LFLDFKVQKLLFLSTFLLIFLAACSPQSYQVNPQPDVSTKPNEIPESQQEDYMRIIGDLRWDKLTSQKDWETRFPGCLTQQYYDGNNEETKRFVSLNLYPIGTRSANEKNYREDYYESPNPKCAFIVGGIQFYLNEVRLHEDSTGKRPARIEYILYLIPRPDQNRAFEAAMKEKYTETIERKSYSVGSNYGEYDDFTVCSKYSCFHNYQIKPTDYTTSILDSVKVDPSAF